MKIICWDLECSNLSADFGIILTCTTQEVGLTSEKNVLRIDDYPSYVKRPWDDRGIVIDIKKILDGADIWVTYNGKWFDVPFLNARLLYHGIGRVIPVKHIDLYQIAKWKMKLSRKRAEAVAEFLGCRHQKSPMKGSEWTKALTGVRSSMDYIVRHNQEDVAALVDLLDRMRGLIDYIK